MMKTPANDEEWSCAIHTDLGDLTGTAGKSMVGLFALFVGWAFIVPIESAVNAPGIFVSSGKNQTLQHRPDLAAQRRRAHPLYHGPLG